MARDRRAAQRHGRRHGRGRVFRAAANECARARGCNGWFGAGATVLALAVSPPRTADAITIVPTFDASVTGNVNSAAIQNAFNYVALTYKNLYSDPIQINVTVVAGSSGL